MVRAGWIVGLGLAAGLAAASGPPDRVAEGRAVVARFQERLKAELLAALEAGGEPRAIEVCRRRAPEIAARVSEETGWAVGRTSLRLRNPANVPDPWERGVLERFEARRAAGEPAGALEAFAQVQRDGRPAFRYMKAIPTGKVCLGCHGERLAPEVERALRAAYPGDRATGFRAGDVRGAFTAARPAGAGP